MPKKLYLTLLLVIIGAAQNASAQTLQSPPAAVRVANRAQLTGLELGTMWTFENPPLKYWQKQYNFAASKDWLDHVRLASVRYGEICSASFVSPNGLVITNHHCGRECVSANSNAGTDYVIKGFYAATRDDEKLCPELFLDQLVSVEDVTARVQAASKGATAEAISRAQAAAIEQLQNQCSQAEKLNCQLVTLYHGGQYELYKYKRYNVVKLVFAPELQAGFFGGDPDNFTYPRYDLDFSVVRAYDDDGKTPATITNYFKWRSDPVRAGELVFVTGNPGSTSRQITVSRLLYEREFRHPFLIDFLSIQRDVLNLVGKASPEMQQQVRENLFEVENSLKANVGEFAGLQDSLLLGQKIRWERELRNRINADPKLRAQYADVFDKITAIQVQKMQVSPRLNLSNPSWLGAPHLLFASQLVHPEPGAPPTAGTPNPLVSNALLKAHLTMIARYLPATDSLRLRVFKPGETPEAAAQRLAQGSRIMDESFREQLTRAGVTAADTSHDPLLQVARAMARESKGLTERWQQLTAAEGVQQERLAKAIFAAFGKDIPPDATFTLRISDGLVQGYPFNGTIAPVNTTFYGIFARATEFDNQDPFTLPAAYAANRASVNMATQLDFVTTNDITGGNSGSPVIDREARIVGLAFDSNIEALPNEFLYRNETQRAVSVSTAGITEALRNIYHADALLRELTGASK